MTRMKAAQWDRAGVDARRSRDDQGVEAERALARLIEREELLEIGYWYQGEGFGDTFDAQVLLPFLKQDAETIGAVLADLAAAGDLLGAGGTAYRFSEQGRRKAGRLFAEHFSDLQKPTHGECEAGCCDGDDHSRCGDECALH